MAEAETEAADAEPSREEREVRKWRRKEALEAGLSLALAQVYAESIDIDCSNLRRLVKAGATPEQIASALL